MNALCLIVAGSLAALLPAEFTLSWTHSVEKTEWQEDYAVTDEGIALVAARVRGSGAGMEPGKGAQLKDGWWQYKPETSVVPKLTLSRSEFAKDYQLCWDGECQAIGTLADRAAEGASAHIQPCLLERPERETSPGLEGGR